MRQRAWPERIINAEGMRHILSTMPDHAEQAWFAYDEGGEILGWATAGRAWYLAEPHVGGMDISVEPARRGERIGTALAEAAEAHLETLGVRRARCASLDEPAARALAARRGFDEIGASSVSAVDPGTVDPLPIPNGVELRPFAEIDDPTPIYELDMEVSPDIPNEEFDSITLEEWVETFWRSPLIDDRASLAGYVDGELAAVTMIRVDPPSGRAQNNLAGVRRQYRGRGLALLLKSHSLRRAAALGATIAITDNDETNAPMLAVNTKLGYRPLARRLEWERRST
jgi:GNAT superfamily N-acetyltransferase